ncbi:MAG: helix-turn-helix domain-containing protein [Acidimicrobiales bacterium]|nr:helix-turn-helix domain-containing protein [Acidimicrobiales bacterium]
MDGPDTTRRRWVAPGLAQLFEIVLDAAGDRRDLTLGERDRFFAAGQTAVDSGGSLSELIDGYLAGAGQLWEQVFGSIEPDGALEVGRSLRRVSESAVGALAEGFESAQRRFIRAEESLRRELFDDLLGGRLRDDPLDERATLAGLPTGVGFAVAVAETDQALSDSGPIHLRADTALAGRAPDRGLITFTKAGQLVVLLPKGTPGDLGFVHDELMSVHDADWWVGVGGRADDLGAVDRAYQEAREALGLCRLFGSARVGVYDTMLAHRVLAGSPEVAAELVAAVLGPLERSSRGDLLETLETFIAHGGNMAAVARAMALGPRTVSYRLDRIAELTGWSAREADGRFTLELALRCRPLVGRRSAGGASSARKRGR